jgi:glycerate dehydrogenase
MSAPPGGIVLLDAATYGDASVSRFTDRWPCTVYPMTDPAQTSSRLAGHAVAVTNKVVIDSAVLNSTAASDLKLIAVAATGTDIIAKDAASRRGVSVCNVPAYATDSVAQFTFALLLQLATSAGRYANDVKAGEWQKSPVFSLLTHPAVELNGKKLGIVGYGNIGQAVARMARGFGMDILVAARPDCAPASVPAGRLPLEQVLREADFISLHCPLTPETKNLINRRSLSWMKPSAALINTARGALIDEAALIAALREKRIAGAALDVISQEPPPADHPIIQDASKLENLIVTPHTAWSARESRERLLAEVEANIAGFLAGAPRNLVE